MDDSKDTKESKGLKELKQTLKAKSKELKKAKREYDMEQLSEKMSCLPALILQNEALSKLILDLPNDETKIVFKEVIGSGEFTVLRHTLQNKTNRNISRPYDRYYLVKVGNPYTCSKIVHDDTDWDF